MFWCQILTGSFLSKPGSGTFSKFRNALWFWNLACPLMPAIGKHDWSEFKVANRRPIPYYVSLRFIRVGAKSGPGAFYPNVVLEPFLSSTMPYGSGTWLGKHDRSEFKVPKRCSGTFSKFCNALWFWNLACPLMPSIKNMIDQNSRWQIGGPFLTTFHCVSWGLVPNPDRELFIQTWFWNLF